MNEEIDINEALKRAKELVVKLDEVNTSQDFIGVFQFAQAHGWNYQGPSYYNELEALRESLNMNG